VRLQWNAGSSGHLTRLSERTGLGSGTRRAA
jgi:hypothetical protein